MKPLKARIRRGWNHLEASKALGVSRSSLMNFEAAMETRDGRMRAFGLRANPDLRSTVTADFVLRVIQGYWPDVKLGDLFPKFKNFEIIKNPNPQKR